MKRKLIEVALPLDAISAASAREKSIRRGHPSTLHLWWSRKPLAACRAVLFSQLVDDPSSLPEEFPTEELQDAERQRLFGIIEELVKWENTTNESVLNSARAEILKSTDGNPPPILDPFAGGGSIPLEAQRLGLEVHASDLNPVAVLINKAMIEIPPRWADMPPVHPDAEQRTHWRGAEGLAEDVRLYGQWLRDEAEKRIGHLYPKAVLEDGSAANVIAWIWARAIACPNPVCGAKMPLIDSLWLGKKKGKEAWINPIVDIEAKTVSFEIGHGPEGPPDPPKVGRGAKFRCLVCSGVATEEYVRAEGVAGRMGATLLAVVAEGNRRRVYLPPSAAPVPLVPGGVNSPSLSLSDHPQYMGATRYGMGDVKDLFSSRQAVALSTFAGLVATAGRRAEHDSDLEPVIAAAYGKAIQLFLSLVVSRLTDYQSMLTTWASNPQMEILRNTFARQALAMAWGFAEGNPFGTSSGTLDIMNAAVARAIELLPAGEASEAVARDARNLKGTGAISTDPPYYANVPYADISDFFYPWLRTMVGDLYPELFSTMGTPKTEELIADVKRFGGRDSANVAFERGFLEVFAGARAAQAAGFPMSLFYAFKQSESDDSDGLGSTGWSTMLEGLVQAGWSVTATWPIRTERSGRTREIGSNALASSVVLACRPRAADAGLTDRHGLVRALRSRLPAALHELQKAYIAPVDLRQAAIGPGMRVFSSYSRVVEADGNPMRVRAALGLINQVLDQVLGEQEAEFDAETRWAIQWFSQFFEDEAAYGGAEQLAVAMNISVEGMVQSGIVESGGGRVRLLGRDEYPNEWDPTTDERIPVWEACQHLVRRLNSEGEVAAGTLLSQLGGLGESARLLAYRLYTVCEQARPALAAPYNALVASWPEIQGYARSGRAAGASTAPSQGELL